MKNKVTEFPPRANSHGVPEEPMVLFILGDQRFAVQWIVTELRPDPAEVIPFQKRRGKKKQRSART